MRGPPVTRRQTPAFVLGVTRLLATQRVQRQQSPSFDHPHAHSAVPSIEGDPSVVLSVVIPAYNETRRLPPMLRDSARYLKDQSRSDPKFLWEVRLWGVEVEG